VPCARILRARQLQRFVSFGGRRPTGGIAGLGSGLPRKTRPNSVGIRQAYYQTQLGAGFTAIVWRPALPWGGGRQCSPLPSVYPAGHRLERAHPLTGHRWPYNKKPLRCRELWWQSNGFSVSGQLRGANAQTSAIPGEGGNRHRTPSAGRHRSDRFAPRQVGLRRDLFLPTRPASICAPGATLSSQQQPWWRTPPVAPCVASVVTWQPANSGLDFPLESALAGGQHHLLTTSGSECGVLTTRSGP